MEQQCSQNETKLKQAVPNNQVQGMPALMTKYVSQFHDNIM